MSEANAERLSAPTIILRKRDGFSLREEELRWFIDAYVSGALPDYQASALLMAIFFRGMDKRETVALTRTMLESGERADLSAIAGLKVDKHSTGGVGDKISLILAPLVAACGVPVPMMSGRGLGHTGGTLDKLEAIPGFRTSLTLPAFAEQVGRLGCAFIGQSERMVPADRRLYALRDVTATVESIPLITASILSKKVAEGIDGLVLDVKVGSGAFMKTEADARLLAESLIRVGEGLGLRVRAILTRMEAPLGYAIGNALEVLESLDVLEGQGPEDVRQCTEVLAEAMLCLGLPDATQETARAAVKRALSDGSAHRRFLEVVEAQGGNLGPLGRDPFAWPQSLAPNLHVHTVLAPEAGYIATQDAYALGECARALGAGRQTADASVDPYAGLLLHAKHGAQVERGAPLLTLISNDPTALKAAATTSLNAHAFSATAPEQPPLIIDQL